MNTTGRSMMSIYFLESKYEFLNVWRTPGFVLPSLAFPLMFYLFFGVVFGKGSLDQATYLVATYGAFGIMGLALFGFGVGVATERGQGWLLLKQASPMPAMAYFTAKLVMSLILGQILLVLLFNLAAFAGQVSLSWTQWFKLILILGLGSIPFCALGLVIGCWAKSKSAVAVVNLVYLPMAFLSGLWIPISLLPQMLQKTAVIFPPYHLSQLALKVLDMDVGGNPWVHTVVLFGQTVLFLILALIGFRRKTQD